MWVRERSKRIEDIQRNENAFVRMEVVADETTSKLLHCNTSK